MRSLQRFFRDHLRIHLPVILGGSLLLTLAGLCQGINLAYSLWLMRKWQDQFREELENSGD